MRSRSRSCGAARAVVAADGRRVRGKGSRKDKGSATARGGRRRRRLPPVRLARVAHPRSPRQVPARRRSRRKVRRIIKARRLRAASRRAVTRQRANTTARAARRLTPQRVVRRASRSRRARAHCSAAAPAVALRAATATGRANANRFARRGIFDAVWRSMQPRRVDICRQAARFNICTCVSQRFNTASRTSSASEKPIPCSSRA